MAAAASWGNPQIKELVALFNCKALIYLRWTNLKVGIQRTNVKS